MTLMRPEQQSFNLLLWPSSSGQQLCDSLAAETTLYVHVACTDNFCTPEEAGLNYILVLMEVKVELVHKLRHPVWNGPYSCRTASSSRRGSVRRPSRPSVCGLPY